MPGIGAGRTLGAAKGAGDLAPMTPHEGIPWGAGIAKQRIICLPRLSFERLNRNEASWLRLGKPLARRAKMQ
jgi:hypothetical protein